jgi:ankyrin repeat protein
VSTGNTALIYCAAMGNDVATELLTRNFRRLGLQVDHYNNQGNTAVLVACKNANLNCAKILAQKGRASVTLKVRIQ